MKSLIVSLFFGVLVSSHIATAAPLIEDSFEGYGLGDLNNAPGWTASTDVDVVSGGLSYSNGDIAITGGAQHVSSNALSAGLTPLASHTFAAQSGEVWFSFTLNATTSGNNPRYWFFVSDDPSLTTGLTGAVGDTNTGSDGLFAEIRRDSTPNAAGPEAFTDGLTYFLVGRLSKDGTVGGSPANAYDQMDLWINPSSATLGTPTRSAQTSTASSFIDGIDTFGLTALSSAALLQWDNLLVGTTQADVVDVYVSVPEPASLLLALAGATLVVRRKR